MKHLFTSAFILFCANVFAQDSIITLTRGGVYTDTIPMVIAYFPGGDSAWHKFYAETMKYPKFALENKVEGKVIVSFNVEEDGTLTDVRILETPHKILSDEVLRIIRLMPKWKPATKGGKPVKYRMNLPITFKI